MMKKLLLLTALLIALPNPAALQAIDQKAAPTNSVLITAQKPAETQSALETKPSSFYERTKKQLRSLATKPNMIIATIVGLVAVRSLAKIIDNDRKKCPDQRLYYKITSQIPRFRLFEKTVQPLAIPQGQDCPVCETYEATHFLTASCQHAACNSCLNHMITNAITNGTARNLWCGGCAREHDGAHTAIDFRTLNRVILDTTTAAQRSRIEQLGQLRVQNETELAQQTRELAELEQSAAIRQNIELFQRRPELLKEKTQLEKNFEEIADQLIQHAQALERIEGINYFIPKGFRFVRLNLEPHNFASLQSKARARIEAHQGFSQNLRSLLPAAYNPVARYEEKIQQISPILVDMNNIVERLAAIKDQLQQLEGLSAHGVKQVQRGVNLKAQIQLNRTNLAQYNQELEHIDRLGKLNTVMANDWFNDPANGGRRCPGQLPNGGGQCQERFLNENGTRETRHCTTCGIDNCPNCSEIHPENLACEAIAESNAYQRAVTKYCPNPTCGKAVFRIAGCNHMTCSDDDGRGGCGHKFCWVCGKPGSGNGANWRATCSCPVFGAN